MGPEADGPFLASTATMWTFRCHEDSLVGLSCARPKLTVIGGDFKSTITRRTFETVTRRTFETVCSGATGLTKPNRRMARHIRQALPDSPLDLVDVDHSIFIVALIDDRYPVAFQPGSGVRISGPDAGSRIKARATVSFGLSSKAASYSIENRPKWLNPTSSGTVEIFRGEL